MFKDIGKPSRDFLENDYFFCQKFTYKTTNQSNISVSAEAEINQKGPISLLAVSWRSPSNVNLSIDKLRIKSDGRVLLEASLQPTPAVKFTVCAEDGRVEISKPLQSFGKLGMEYRSSYQQTSADVDIVNGPIFRGSSMIAIGDKSSLGFEGALNMHSEDKSSSSPSGIELSDLAVGMTSRGPNWQFSLLTLEYLGAVRFNYLHTISEKLSFGTQLDYRLKSNSQKITFGTKYEIDDKCTFKAKANSNAVVSGSFVQKLSDFCKLAICAEVNVHDWSVDSHKFGIGLDFHP